MNSWRIACTALSLLFGTMMLACGGVANNENAPAQPVQPPQRAQNDVAEAKPELAEENDANNKNALAQPAQPPQRAPNDVAEAQPELAKENDTAKKKNIEYTIVKSPGLRQVILIDKKHRNRKDMLRLGEQLRQEHAEDSFCFIVVFDNKQAADMMATNSYDSFDENSTEMKLYRRHMLGTYNKNDRSGLHQFTFTLAGAGIGGKTTQCDYVTGKVTTE
jgi:hypothetical protein